MKRGSSLAIIRSVVHATSSVGLNAKDRNDSVDNWRLEQLNGAVKVSTKALHGVIHDLTVPGVS